MAHYHPVWEEYEVFSTSDIFPKASDVDLRTDSLAIHCQIAECATFPPFDYWHGSSLVIIPQ